MKTRGPSIRSDIVNCYALLAQKAMVNQNSYQLRLDLEARSALRQAQQALAEKDFVGASETLSKARAIARS
ncbi:MAG: flagellar protein FliS [Bryobacteraceae bacterium]|nr:flagellar protein FliS [Bryobacteraceae bacterium]